VAHILIGAVICGIASAFVGLILSQYWPVFGGFIENNLAEPWSSARIHLIPVHVLALGLIGAFFGGVLGFLLTKI
jgi:hypothetical protein